jgi:hypothetical protein
MWEGKLGSFIKEEFRKRREITLNNLYKQTEKPGYSYINKMWTYEAFKMHTGRENDNLQAFFIRMITGGLTTLNNGFKTPENASLFIQERHRTIRCTDRCSKHPTKVANSLHVIMCNLDTEKIIDKTSSKVGEAAGTIRPWWSE